MDTWKGRSNYLLIAGIVALLLVVILLVVWLQQPADDAMTTMAGPRTTITITKGRPGLSTIWEVTTAGATTQLAATVPVSSTLWQKMNGPIASFRYTDCDGQSSSVMELRYRTKVEGEPDAEVYTSGTVGSGLRWDFPGCEVSNAPCTFPARYFDPTYYPTGSQPCSDPGRSESWKIELQ